MATLTARNEDYLKTIYKLESERKVVRVKDLAQALGVRSPTVVGSVSSLKDSGLVEQEHYGYIALTPEGAARARELVQRERLLKDFFHRILALDEEEAVRNACSIEHYITPLCRKRFVEFIQFLEMCEKGIPTWLEHFKTFLTTGEKPPCDHCSASCPDTESGENEQ